MKELPSVVYIQSDLVLQRLHLKKLPLAICHFNSLDSFMEI